MSRLQTNLRRACHDLESERVPFALVGGLAVSVRTEPRFTRDADFAVAVGSDSEAESLVYRLQRLEYKVQATVEQEALSRLATVRLIPPGESEAGTVVDLLFASSGIESEIIGAADAIKILPGLEVPVARTGHLIALKVLSRDDQTRPQDFVDLRALVEVALEEDLDLAREASRLIVSRGYHRDRDLLSELEKLLHVNS